MNLPAPKPGLVIRYSFLWSRQKRRGAEEGAKDRPCAIVVATKRTGEADLRVVVAPITHTPPDDTAAMEIPARVRKSLGLDDERQWLRYDELNAFAWPGFDLRPIPGTKGRYAYGMLPEPLFEKLRAAILDLNAKGKAARPVSRD